MSVVVASASVTVIVLVILESEQRRPRVLQLDIMSVAVPVVRLSCHLRQSDSRMCPEHAVGEVPRVHAASRLQQATNEQDWTASTSLAYLPDQ